MLVICVFASLITGFFFIRIKSYKEVHIVIGLIITSLVIFRIFWGFLGSHFSRFKSFLFGPTHTLSHLKELAAGQAPAELGHNPIGALMVFALLTTLFGLICSGFVIVGGILQRGPLSDFLTEQIGQDAKQIHKLLALTICVLIGGHLAGVVFETLRTRENIVSAMITGFKNSSEGTANMKPVKARPLIACLFSVIFVAPLAATTFWETITGQKPQPAVAAAPVDEQAVLHVLDTYCASCHQSGRLEANRKTPAARFDDILDLKKLAANTDYVHPGLRNDSKLFQDMEDHSMPDKRGCDGGTSVPNCPAEDEIQIIGRWIDGLAKESQQQVAAQATQQAIAVRSVKEIARLIDDDLKWLAPAKTKNTRYISLAHLADSGASETDMTLYRSGVVKLLNSLSRSADVIIPEPIDSRKAILRFDISGIGWKKDDWDAIVEKYPYGIDAGDGSWSDATRLTGTPLPIIRGDWFAANGTVSPLYDKLLHIPGTLDELASNLGIDFHRDIERGAVARAGFKKSGVSDNNRIIERHSGVRVFWTS